MEFHLAEAKKRGCDMVVTVGGLQSNHCRTTAVAAATVGLEIHLLLAMEVNTYFTVLHPLKLPLNLHVPPIRGK